MSMIHCDKCGKDMRVHEGALPRGWSYRVCKAKKGIMKHITVCPDCSRKERYGEEQRH